MQIVTHNYNTHHTGKLWTYLKTLNAVILAFIHIAEKSQVPATTMHIGAKRQLQKGSCATIQNKNVSSDPDDYRQEVLSANARSQTGACDLLA